MTAPASHLAAPAPVSQCAQILAVLADGRPHSYHEIHARIGFCRLNSRIAELRTRGHRIECDKTGGDYRYKLIDELDAAPSLAAQAREGAASSVAGQRPDTSAPVGAQLSLLGAAA